MLSVKTNKNINNFKSTFLGGFDFKESIAIIISTVLGVGINLLLMFFTSIPKILIVYIPIVFITLPLILIFYKKDGMNFFKHKKIERDFKKSKPLQYISTENPSNYKLILENINQCSNVINQNKFKRTLIISIAFLSVLAIFIIVIIIYFLF